MLGRVPQHIEHHVFFVQSGSPVKSPGGWGIKGPPGQAYQRHFTLFTMPKNTKRQALPAQLNAEAADFTPPFSLPVYAFIWDLATSGYR